MDIFEENLEQIVRDFSQGTLSAEEVKELEQWCNLSTENKELYKITLLLIKSSDIEHGIAAFEQKKEVAFQRFLRRVANAGETTTKERQNHLDKQDIAKKQRETERWDVLRRNSAGRNRIIGKLFTRPLVKYAAILVIAFTLGTVLGQTEIFHSGNNIAENPLVYKVEIPFGSKGKVILPDGTMVWLNSGSILSYTSDFGKENRNVNLNGEGNFDVTKSNDVPFIVISDKITARVYGTKFNFKSYEGDMLARVTLIEGSLSVINSNNKGDSTLLAPDQQALLIKDEAGNKNGALRINKVKAADYQEWTKEAKQEVNEKLLDLAEIAKQSNITMPTISPNNSILFDNEPMFQIIKDLERMYNVTIQMNEPAILQRHFYGNFRNEESLYDIIDIIARTNGLQYKITDNVIHFYTNK